MRSAMKALVLLRAAALVALTPLLEKNLIKRFAIDVPFVFSMARVIVLAFALGMLRHIWVAGVVGWPDATLSMAVVLALPLFGALDRVAPERVVDLASSLFGRFGVGERGARAMDVGPASGVATTRSTMGSVLQPRRTHIHRTEFCEPSKFDDHRGDSA